MRPSRRELSRHQRQQRLRRILYAAGAALAVLTVLIIGFGLLRENVLRAQETVGVVHGERITAGELAEQARPALAVLDQRIRLLRNNGLEQQAVQLQFQRAQIADTVLNEMIERRIVRREAAQRGINVTPTEVQERIAALVAQFDPSNQPVANPSPATEAAAAAMPVGTPTPRPTATPVPTLTEDRFGPVLQEYLNETGLTETELLREVQDALLEEKVRAAIGENVPAIQEQVRARHLVYEDEAAANAAYEQLQQGASFDQLAEQARQSGASFEVDLGWLPRLGRDPLRDDTLFQLQAGEVSRPVQTSEGWEILQVLERDPARPLSEQQLEELRSQRYNAWIAEAIGSPEIQRELSADEAAWVLQRAGGRRS